MSVVDASGSACLALAAAACGQPEKAVVDNYFNAVNAKDNQTLTSFAAVSFDEPVQSWKIKDTLRRDQRRRPPCPSSSSQAEGRWRPSWPPTRRPPGAYVTRALRRASTRSARPARRGRRRPRQARRGGGAVGQVQPEGPRAEEGGGRGQGRGWRRRSATMRLSVGDVGGRGGPAGRGARPSRSTWR